MADARIPVILCIDVEPDEHVYPLERPSPWHGFELITRRLPRLRRNLEEATGEAVRFSWDLRMDPQIDSAYGSPTWAVHRYRPVFDDLLEHGDVLGVHPHAWRWDPSARVWISDHADQSWVDRCVEMSFQAYGEAFGERPAFHRFGTRFMSTPTMNLVRELGGRIDLTVEPGETPLGPGEFQGGVLSGETPDFTNAPRVPYRPDPSDFLRPGGEVEGLWAIPLSSGPHLLKQRRHLSRRVLRKATGRLVHPVRSARGMRRRMRREPAALQSQWGAERAPFSPAQPEPRHRTLFLWLNWRSPADFWDQAFAAADGLEMPYLAFAIRSDLPTHRDEYRRFHAVLRHLSRDPRARRMVFTTPEEAIRHLGLLL
jgi:hypothetical protein